MEHAAHDVVVVPSEDRDAVAALPVPDADGLQAGAQFNREIEIAIDFSIEFSIEFFGTL